MCVALHVFHAFIGCDIVSFWGGGGCEKATWVTWQSYPEATGAFEDLLLLLGGIHDQTMPILERFEMLFWDRASDITKVHCFRLVENNCLPKSSQYSIIYHIDRGITVLLWTILLRMLERLLWQVQKSWAENALLSVGVMVTALTGNDDNIKLTVKNVSPC